MKDEIEKEEAEGEKKQKQRRTTNRTQQADAIQHITLECLCECGFLKITAKKTIDRNEVGF